MRSSNKQKGRIYVYTMFSVLICSKYLQGSEVASIFFPTKHIYLTRATPRPSASCHACDLVENDERVLMVR